LASRSFSRAAFSKALIFVLLATGATGCVLVRPEEREFLADPGMTFGAEGSAMAQEEHVLSNREGAAGAGSVTGGGCGCN
jgi:hypothetical protein